MSEVLKPFYNPGPGDIIKDAMEELGWQQDDLAEILGLSLKSVNLILNNKQAITPETAELLGKTFSTSAEMWLNLDAKYQLRKLEEKPSEKKELTYAKAEFRKLMPVYEMKKKGWFVNDVSTVYGIKAERKRIFGDEEKAPQNDSMNFCARQTNFDYDYTLAYCNVWYQFAKIFAEKESLPVFNKAGLEKIAENLCAYTLEKDGINKIISDLHSCGVGFFVLSHLQKTYLDGAAFTLGDNPFIVYTARYDRVDNFWFVLAHEISHILLHFDHLAKGCLDDMDSSAGSELEIQADEKASELLHTDEILALGTQYRHYFTLDRLRQISESLQIAAPVVLGILQHYKIIEWKKFSNLRESVKDKIDGDVVKG
ncbi:MAG: HigA family addiction module antidote protein [Treponema sp.]|nr:HigA family addiction module antidote protein [Treponema sp.]